MKVCETKHADFFLKGGGSIKKKRHVQYIWANVVHASVTHVDNTILHRVPSHTWAQVERLRHY